MLGTDIHHQHFAPSHGPRDRHFSDGQEAPAGDGAGGGVASPEASFSEIGHAAYEAEASHEAAEDGDGGTSADPPAPATVDADAGEGAADAAQTAANLLEAVQGEAMRLDPEALPEELRPFIKQFQADYTRKTQQLAEQRKRAAEELAGDELAQLRQKIADLEGRTSAGTSQEGAQQAPDIKGFARARVEAELGPLISTEEFFSAQDNATVMRFLEQQTRLAAVEAVAQYHLEVVDPQVAGIQSTLTARQQAEVRSQYETFTRENPDLAPYEAEVAALYSAGKTLDEAAALVRKAVTADGAVANALATGAQIGEARAKQVAEAKDKYDVPHSSTAGKGGPSFTPEMSFQEIAEKAAREAGVL